MQRREILECAIDAVTGQRAQDHGELENSFFMIAKLWSVYWGETFKPKDVACMMALLKIARTATGHDKWDSYVDACGYMACAGELDESLNKVSKERITKRQLPTDGANNKYIPITVDKQT